MASNGNDAAHPGRECPLDETLALKEGLSRVLLLSGRMLNFMKGVDERLNNMDERISQLLERVDKFSGNLDTVIAVTNNISLEIAKSNKTECSTKMDQNTMSTNPPEPETTVSPPTKQDWPLDRQLKIGPPKSFTDLSPKNVTNIIFDVSDEDEGIHVGVEALNNEVGHVQGNNPHVPHNDENCNKKVPSSQKRGRASTSNYARRSKSKCDVSNRKETNFLGKKLFQTPTSNSNGKGSKRAKGNAGPSDQQAEPTHSPEIIQEDVRQKTIKTPSSNILPKTMLSRFRPSTDMKLSEWEVKVAAYIFSYDGDEDEILVKLCDIEATRKDFVTLCPDRLVNNKMMTLSALKGSWTQARKTEKTVWYLPPAFTDDVLEGYSTDDLITKYARVSMQPYPQLKFIYVPVKESSEHWFLMVVSLEEQLIYYLDSNLRWESVRRNTIRNLCEALTKIMTSEAYPEDFLHSDVQLEMWELSVARNVTNGGTT
ncbi:Ulp1 protease family, C-terminal catalytic domain [Sesbania bispinosa]|nr:Ulp1 protease family, C-terminal catalytic domain [Sesbania bispinosa]